MVKITSIWLDGLLRMVKITNIWLDDLRMVKITNIWLDGLLRPLRSVCTSLCGRVPVEVNKAQHGSGEDDKWLSVGLKK